MADKLRIVNRALQRIGAKRLIDLTENSRERLAIDAVYDDVVEQELQTNFWTFTIKRVSIDPDPTGPIFGRAFSFTEPADYLRSAPRDPAESDFAKTCLHELGKILSHFGGPLELRYVSDLSILPSGITLKEELFSPLFANALSMRVGMETAEELTGSSSKVSRLEDAYTFFVRKARQTNAIEAGPIESEIDEFVAVRLTSRGTNLLLRGFS